MIGYAGPGYTWTELSVVDAVLLLGVGVVLPLALGGGWRRWALAAGSTAASLLVPRGLVGALLVLPWVAVAALVLAAAVAGAGPLFFWTGRDVVATVARAYAVVAALAFLSSRAGLEAFGVTEPIVELTAVHYTYAGVAALVLAGAAAAGVTGRWRPVATIAVVGTALAPLVVAFGFVSHAAVPQVGGAVLMAFGVWATATLELRRALVDRRVTGARRALLVVSGLTVWVPMVLAVAWAAGQHWDVPALSIPAMARTHGLVNALAFVLCGLIALRLADRDRTTRPTRSSSQEAGR